MSRWSRPWSPRPLSEILSKTDSPEVKYSHKYHYDVTKAPEVIFKDSIVSTIAYDLAAISAFVDQDFDQALVACQRSLAQDPKQVLPIFVEAVAFFDSGQFELAMHSFWHASRFQSARPLALFMWKLSKLNYERPSSDEVELLIQCIDTCIWLESERGEFDSRGHMQLNLSTELQCLLWDELQAAWFKDEPGQPSLQKRNLARFQNEMQSNDHELWPVDQRFAFWLQYERIGSQDSTLRDFAADGDAQSHWRWIEFLQQWRIGKTQSELCEQWPEYLEQVQMHYAKSNGKGDFALLSIRPVSNYEWMRREILPEEDLARIHASAVSAVFDNAHSTRLADRQRISRMVDGPFAKAIKPILPLSALYNVALERCWQSIEQSAKNGHDLSALGLFSDVQKILKRLSKGSQESYDYSNRWRSRLAHSLFQFASLHQNQSLLFAAVNEMQEVESAMVQSEALAPYLQALELIPSHRIKRLVHRLNMRGLNKKVEQAHGFALKLYFSHKAEARMKHLGSKHVSSLSAREVAELAAMNHEGAISLLKARSKQSDHIARMASHFLAKLYSGKD